MRILAVDTSSERGSICVSDNGEIVAEVRLASSLQHSERLFGSIEFAFRFLNFRLQDVDLFAAAKGPGSFTGLRVGMAAAEGFVAAFGKQGVGVSTLEALAWNAHEFAKWIAPTIDARRGEIYGAVYRRDGDELIEVCSPVVLKPAQWLNSLSREPIVFCGDGAVRYRELLTGHPEWECRTVDLYLARAIAEMAQLPRRGPLEPLYVRRTDAEIDRERRRDESIASPHP
jgi:tRNA threonylcarbamoyladenosine biosynthesis protein TsaB